MKTVPLRHETPELGRRIYSTPEIDSLSVIGVSSSRQGKAGFWRARGFNEANVEALEQGLLNIAYSEDVKEVVPSPYGVKYVIEGMIQTPTGSTIQVRTVWIIETNQDRPRFVSAYPA